MAAVIVGAIDQQPTNARRAHFSEGDFLWPLHAHMIPLIGADDRHFFHELLRISPPHWPVLPHRGGLGDGGAEREKSGPFSSIRIVLDWRRIHPAVDASGVSRADRPRVRRDKLLRPSGIPGFADVGSQVLFRRGLCRRDHDNNRQRSCVHGQCETPYRKFAHAPLPLNAIQRR